MKPQLHPDAMPVRLVIWFVGIIGVASLLIAAWLFWLGKSGEGVLAITNGCVMGLLGLLARTDTRQGQRQGDAPNGTPENPINVTATDEAPVATTSADEPTPDEPSAAPRPSPLSKVVQTKP